MTEITRREFIRLSALAAAGVTVAACAKTAEPTTPPEAEATATPKPEEATATPKPVEKAEGKEAPMLADLVKAGTLAPLDERVPSPPRVIPVLESIGKHGGIVRRGFKGVSDGPGPNKFTSGGFVWFNHELGIDPHIAESWEINDDASVWTWHFRKGTKWSDGQPYTSGDIKWYYDNVLRNETLTSGTPRAWSTGSPRVLMELEAPDDFTLVLKFADPNPLFAYLHVVRGGPYVPGHYLQQFHMDLADDKAALEAQVKDAGFDAWDGLYGDKNNWQTNADRPVVRPWESETTAADELFIMKRNAYYFGSDAEGQQLPYIDQVDHRLFSTPDVFNMWVLNGEIDFQGRHVSVGNYGLFKDGEDAGDYRILHGFNGNTTSINWNLTCKDQNIREFLQSRDVRFAMNYAVDRDEINELIYDGLAKPRQCGPMDQSPQYYEKLALAYLEQDPDKANELLDKAGYTEKDDEGFRLWKDGSGRAGFNIEYISKGDEDVVALYVKYFAEAGIQCTYKYVERSLYTERFNANDVEASVAFGVGRSLIPMIAADILLGTAIDHPWACAWGMWRNDPSNPNAEEPPADHWIRRMWNAYDQISVEPDGAKREQLFREILEVWYEELPMAGFLSQFVRPIVVKNGLHNYIDGLAIDTTTSDTNIANLQTLYWENPAEHT